MSLHEYFFDKDDLYIHLAGVLAVHKIPSTGRWLVVMVSACHPLTLDPETGERLLAALARYADHGKFAPYPTA